MAFRGYDPTGKLAGLSPQERLKAISNMPGYQWLESLQNPEGGWDTTGYWGKVLGAMSTGGNAPPVHLQRIGVEGNEMGGLEGSSPESQDLLDAERAWRQMDPMAPQGSQQEMNSQFSDEMDRGWNLRPEVQALYFRRLAKMYRK